MPDETGKIRLKARETCRWDVLSLGEVMLRFDPGEGRIVGSRMFRVWEGGGEYNVTRALRRCFGLRTSVVTALVDNAVGRLVEDLMLQGGVDTSHIRWSAFDGVGRASRNGMYFLERGFGVRPGLGVMDRGHSAISQMKPGAVDWDAIFGGEGVRWFHTGGIMAALSDDTTEVVREAMVAAKRHGTVVSFDGNYRASLWKERGGRAGAIVVNRLLLPMVDVLFGHEGDLVESEHSHQAAWHTLETFVPMAKRVIAEFPQVKLMVTSMRRVDSASRNDWSAFAYGEGGALEGMRLEGMEVMDRVGGGDSLAAGVIYGVMEDKVLRWALDCGVASGALAMTTPGDASMATLAEVERLMSGKSKGTIR